MTTATERNERISKLFRVARPKFPPVTPPASRTLLEHLVYACLLEDATFDAADEVFARLQLDYVDWNEIRVTTPVELAELMRPMPEPDVTALRLRRSLHGLFEAHYSFDLEFLKKENLGKAIEQIGKYRGMTPFAVAWVTQHGLGGHSIPVDQSLMNLMVVLGIVDAADAASLKVTGMERVIPKNQGIEFGSVVHQLAVAWRTTPFSNDLRALLKKVAPDCEARFPKRGGKARAAAVVPPAPPPAADPKKKKPEPPEAARPTPPKKIAAKPAVPPPRSAAPGKSAPGKKNKPAPAKPSSGKPKPPARKEAARDSSRKLARKKPR